MENFILTCQPEGSWKSQPSERLSGQITSASLLEKKTSDSGQTTFCLNYCVKPDVAKGLIVLLSDHPALPLEVSVDCVMEVEVVENCGEAPHSSRILHNSSGFILSLKDMALK